MYHPVFNQGGGLCWSSYEPSGSIKFRVFPGYVRTLASPACVCSMQMAVRCVWRRLYAVDDWWTLNMKWQATSGSTLCYTVSWKSSVCWGKPRKTWSIVRVLTLTDGHSSVISALFAWKHVTYMCVCVCVCVCGVACVCGWVVCVMWCGVWCVWVCVVWCGVVCVVVCALCVCMCAVCVCMCVCVCIYIYIHTHTHTHTPVLVNPEQKLGVRGGGVVLPGVTPPFFSVLAASDDLLTVVQPPATLSSAP